MESSNRQKRNRRASLFSLSARIRRREAATTPLQFADHYDDDDCPVCVAARSGGDVLAAMGVEGEYDGQRVVLLTFRR